MKYRYESEIFTGRFFEVNEQLKDFIGRPGIIPISHSISKGWSEYGNENPFILVLIYKTNNPTP